MPTDCSTTEIDAGFLGGSKASRQTRSMLVTAVEVGALLSYRPNFADLFQRSADYVDKQ
jgi:hypothetical protein